MILQISDYPYYWTDGFDIYSYLSGKHKKLSGWRLTYKGRLRYPIKKQHRNLNEHPAYFYKDELIYIFNKEFSKPCCLT